jgi:DNA-directed RNA polymerase subunit RPC12/RpoP
MLNDSELNSGKKQPYYYYGLGLEHDDILRCKDCSRLVTYKTLQKLGCCECGNRRVTEVRTLSESEMHAIRSGEIQFEHSDLFLAEFKGVE